MRAVVVLALFTVVSMGCQTLAVCDEACASCLVDGPGDGPAPAPVQVSEIDDAFRASVKVTHETPAVEVRTALRAMAF